MRGAFSAPKQSHGEIATPELVLSEILRSFLSLRMTESEGARNDRVRGETR